MLIPCEYVERYLEKCDNEYLKILLLNDTFGGKIEKVKYGNKVYYVNNFYNTSFEKDTAREELMSISKLHDEYVNAY